MKHSNIKTSQQVEELSFVIAPPPHIKSDVSVLKDDVQFLTGELFDDRYSPAHISLFKFDDKRHFGDIIKQVEAKAVKFDPFNIFIKGLRYFGHERTVRSILIYSTRLTSRTFLKTLLKKIRGICRSSPSQRDLMQENSQKRGRISRIFAIPRISCATVLPYLCETGNGWSHYRDIMFGN